MTAERWPMTNDQMICAQALIHRSLNRAQLQVEMKPEREFFDASTVAPVPLTPENPSLSGHSTKRSLSFDTETGDETMILFHPPGAEWGSRREGDGVGFGGVTHAYWEEVYIIRGRIWDGNSAKWYGGEQASLNHPIQLVGWLKGLLSLAGSYCCRPPGMFHGPFEADIEEGCEELVTIRHVSAIQE